MLESLLIFVIHYSNFLSVDRPSLEDISTDEDICTGPGGLHAFFLLEQHPGSRWPCFVRCF